MFGIVKENNVYAAVNDTFVAKIVNIQPDDVEQDIDCQFKIIEDSDAEHIGKVEVTASAIDGATTGKIIIPNTVDNGNQSYAVITIGENAFSNCRYITNTGLENNTSVTKISKDGYSECYSIKETGLATNESIVTIGEKAFSGCSGLESTGLATNKTVQTLGSQVFNRCSSLTSTGLGTNNTVTTIEGEGTFRDCENLTDAGFDTNTTLTNIVQWMFSGCYAMQEFVLGENSKVNSIDKYALSRCSIIIKGTKIPTFTLDTMDIYNVYYSPKITDQSELDKLNISGLTIAAYSANSASLKGDVAGTYKSGDIFQLDGLSFDVTYNEVGTDTELFMCTISYDKEKTSFTYSPTKLKGGTNTIIGEYQGVPFSFDVIA